jgi:hypothetical protein
MNEDAGEFLLNAILSAIGLAFAFGSIFMLVRFVKWAWAF